MTKENPIQSAAKEVYDMLLRRQAFEAMQLADELTADTMAQWQRNNSPRHADDLLTAACALAESQIAAGRLKQAINTALKAIATTARTEAGNEQRMICYLTAWNALEQLLNLTIPDDSRRNAVADATRHLGSLLYHYYYATGRDNPDCPALHDAYDALKVMSTLVKIDSDADTTQTLHLLISSLRAADIAE
ncbi:hypothetical protein [Muribaculum intestinale]|jgi:hypothetical protein|uniref:hypothetical protein n=1 Tax=Muribaculum intestinale TaxID=1796646 RepID=UPI0025AEE020|nr:hypothetical protein [Muribaculum intestinale]